MQRLTSFFFFFRFLTSFTSGPAIDGAYRSVFKLNEDKRCPDLIQFWGNYALDADNNVTEILMPEMKEDGMFCTHAKRMLSVDMRHLMAPGTKMSYNSTDIASRLARNSFANQLKESFISSRIMFDEREVVNGVELNRTCGISAPGHSTNMYGKDTFIFNVRGGAGNHVLLGRPGQVLKRIVFPPGAKGLLVVGANAQVCALLAEGRSVLNEPPSASEVVSNVTASSWVVTAVPTTTEATQPATLAPVVTESEDKNLDDGKSACFPGTAIVEIEDGSEKQMSDLEVGDKVLVSAGEYSIVFGFTHKLRASEIQRNFIRLTVDDGERELLLTPGHYIYLNNELKAAGSAQVGDTVNLGDGRTSPVSAVGFELAKGLYNPQTAHGDIVVSGVVASTYTRAVPAAFAHAGLSLPRALHRWFGLYSTAFERGSNLPELTPAGDTAVV